MDHQLQTNKPKFSVAIQSDTYKNLINNTIKDPKVAMKFIADISSVVALNYALQKCDPATILSAGFVAQSLNLSMAPTLGQCYLIPYGDKAQFQIGYKGLVQLCERCGQFETIGARAVHEGEYSGQDEFGEDTFKFSHEYDAKDVIGYYAYMKMINGFKKTLYMTKDQCQAHAKRYSKAYGNGSSTDRWSSDFDAMALKTVLKLLLSRYGMMSVEIQSAVKYDQSVVDANGNADYVDNEEPKNGSGERAGATKEVEEGEEPSENQSSVPVGEEKEPVWENTQSSDKTAPKDPNLEMMEKYAGKQAK